ncbi:MAG TPA: formate/nitrite transporter family protein [Caulobacteraceae bacterium]|jgi:formate/nitrite transporter FocA (FNT family)|nr:formate/nitrite transporter family protein [Caulobacteraceae bacterium]
MAKRAASDSPHLDAEQQEQAAARAPARALVIHEVVRAEGEAELERTSQALLWSGLAAGLSMGFSYALQGLLQHALPDAPWRHAAASLGYTVGFIIVILGRQQLFTESTLTAALPVLTNPSLAKFGTVLRLWTVVLLANLAGTWIFAAALCYLHPFGVEANGEFASLARDTLAGDFTPTVVRAVFAGWLIGLMVWLLPSAGAARLLVIGLITWVVAFGRLSHIIAGSTEAGYAVLLGQAPVNAYVAKFLAPTLIGNIVGGVALVALLNHAPVSDEMDGKKPASREKA